MPHLIMANAELNELSNNKIWFGKAICYALALYSFFSVDLMLSAKWLFRNCATWSRERTPNILYSRGKHHHNSSVYVTKVGLFVCLTLQGGYWDWLELLRTKIGRDNHFWWEVIFASACALVVGVKRDGNWRFLRRDSAGRREEGKAALCQLYLLAIALI